MYKFNETQVKFLAALADGPRTWDGAHQYIGLEVDTHEDFEGLEGQLVLSISDLEFDDHYVNLNDAGKIVVGIFSLLASRPDNWVFHEDDFEHLGYGVKIVVTNLIRGGILEPLFTNSPKLEVVDTNLVGVWRECLGIVPQTPITERFGMFVSVAGPGGVGTVQAVCKQWSEDEIAKRCEADGDLFFLEFAEDHTWCEAELWHGDTFRMSFENGDGGIGPNTMGRAWVAAASVFRQDF